MTQEPARSESGGRDVGLLRAMSARIDQHDPGAFNNLGVLYFSKGLHADAVEAFLRALALDPRMRTAARNLEVAAAKPGACDARLTALSVRLNDDPDDVVARRERAHLYRLIGRTLDATQELDALIADNPDDGASLFERGLVEQRAGDLRRAQRWFERAVNALHDSSIARVHLAEVLYQRGQNEQALETLDAALAQDPSIADAHLLRGFVLGDMGRHEAAILAARQAAQLNPTLQSLQPHLSIENSPVSISDEEPADAALMRYSLGLAFRQRGYFDEARREFERALGANDDDRLSRHAIAELDLIAGEFERARVSYERLLAEAGDHPRYWNEHGVALHQSGAVDDAAESYRTALRWDPRYALAYNNLGVALSDQGDANAAREALQRASELDPTLVRARLNLARWHHRHADPLAALSLLRELVAFHPNDADAWSAIGAVYRDVSQVEEARDAYARAVECRPTHAEARYGLAWALGALNDADGALRETQQALTLSPMRMESRLSVEIDLQRECPEACGALELLSMQHGQPLHGVPLLDADVASLLPDATTAANHGVALMDPIADASAAVAEAEQFATRGVHGEALDRFSRASTALAEEHAAPDAPAHLLWRRAALGQTRSLCLLDRAAEALPVLKALGAEDPNDAEVLALFARSIFAAAGDREAARKVILRILRLEPRSAALMHFTGDTANTIDDEGLALACYRRALAVDPSRPTPRVAIARLLRQRGDVLAARLELVAALSSVPDLREAVLELAQVHRVADRPLDALALLTKYLTQTPTDLEAIVMLAETLVRLDRDDDARVATARVLMHDPAHLPALWLDGVLLARQSRLRDAAERWRTIVRSDAEPALHERATEALAKLESPALRLVG